MVSKNRSVSETKTIPPISVQLYSLRDECAADFPGVLRQLGEAGFVGVELAGFHGLAPAEVAKIAADAGLVFSSAHMGILESGAQAGSLDELAAIGCTTAIVPFLAPEDFDDANTVASHAASINAMAALGRDRGIRVGYHNHWWEFQKQLGGKTAWQYLFDRLDADVFAEVDIYWATVGGIDVPQFLADQGDRVRYLHVKDGEAVDPMAPMVAVGSGSVPIPSLLAAAPYAEWHVVELDRCATDMMTAIVSSQQFLTTSGLSQGR
jgi:sugar phosphate isomerase/epimerase